MKPEHLRLAGAEKNANASAKEKMAINMFHIPFCA